MPGMLRCWACLPMAHCLFISSTLPLCAMAWIVFTCLHNDLQSSMWIEKDEGSKGDLISSKTWIMHALAVAFLQQGGTSTTWQRCKACIAFCVQQSLVLLSKTLFQASSLFHTFSVSAVFCSCWKVDGSLLSQREGIVPGAKPTMVLSAHCAFQGFANWRFFDGFWHCFQTYFLLLESAFTFLVELGVKSLRTGGCFDPPKVGKTRNSEDFAIWRTLASRQADCTHSANGIFHKRTELTVVHGGAVVHQSPCACMCSRILHGDHGSPRLAAQWPCSHFIISFHFKTMLFWSFLLGYLKFWIFHHSFTVSDLHRLPQKSSCGSSYFHRTQLPASFWTSQIALRPSSLLDSFLSNSFHIWSILLALHLSGHNEVVLACCW